MASATLYDSPRLNVLHQALADGQSEALAAFWAEMQAQYIPLFEPIPDDDGHLRATFLWRGEPETRHVLLLSSLVGYAADYSVNQMQRMAGTDIWYKTLTVRRDVQTTYAFSPNDPLKPQASYRSIMDWIIPYWRLDPLNKRDPFLFPADDEDPDDRPVFRSVICGPDAFPQPYVAERAATPKGTVTLHRFTSRTINNTRRVWFHVPPGYRTDGEPYPWLLCFDGWAFSHIIPVPTIVDNLLAEGKIPPMVTILINCEASTRNTELPCNEDFASLIAEEFVPWLHTLLHISADPTRTVVAGSSYGGLASSWLGFRHPELFGNILSLSGSYQWVKPGDPEPGWLTRQYVASDRLPLRFYLDAGLLENGDTDKIGTSLLGMNRHFRDVLKAKGYPVYYAEFSGGHDYLWWQHTLADGLIALL